MTAISVIAILSSTASGAVPTHAGSLTATPVLCPPNAKPVDGGCIDRSPGYVVHGERCKPARKAVPFYRSLTWERQEARGADLADRTPIVRGKTCRWSRYAASVHQARAKSALRSLERFVSTRMLRDFAFCDGCHAWHKAVAEVQRVFPGTESWLLSCSGAEGGHGRWVVFGGGPYYPGAEYARNYTGHAEVGGPLQMVYSTFKGMYRRGVDYVVGKGFRVPRMDSTTAWRSALGQAIAGGWARFTGNDDSHWSASWGNGC